MRRSLLTHLSILICMAALTNAGCSTLQAGIEQTPGPNLPLTATTIALQTANSRLATIIATTHTPTLSPSPATSTPTPTLTTTPEIPRFKSVQFTTQPGSVTPRRFYAAGTQRIYAVWDYENMKTGIVVKRVWKRDGVDWVVREETWDVLKYGSNGTIRDISVFDDDSGLEAGTYSLTLSIDGVVQAGEDEIFKGVSGGFWVLPTDANGTFPSPDKSYTAFIRFAGLLMIEKPDGNISEMASAEEIGGIAWFPDNHHLLYVERDRSNQVAPEGDLGIRHALWLLELQTGQSSLISPISENKYSPVISPDGKYIALLTGSTYLEGCQASPTLVFLELDNQLRRVADYTIDDFTGFTQTDKPGSIVYPAEPISPGNWHDSHTFLIPLKWSCLPKDESPDGIYLLDMDDKTAIRSGDLP
jgi:hypothetical protein